MDGGYSRNVLWGQIGYVVHDEVLWCADLFCVYSLLGGGGRLCLEISHDYERRGGELFAYDRFGGGNGGDA